MATRNPGGAGGVPPAPTPRLRQDRAQRDDPDGPADLRSLVAELGRDASQLAHDELELAKLELRDVAGAFSADIQEAGKTLAKDVARVGVALSLATLAGLALTAGAILAVGQLLGGAFWAGGLIVGLVFLAAAGWFGMRAARDLQTSDALRLEHGRRTLERDASLLRDEAEETARFARQEGRDFKRHATADHPPRSH